MIRDVVGEAVVAGGTLEFFGMANDHWTGQLTENDLITVSFTGSNISSSFIGASIMNAEIIIRPRGR